jgi:hypothetical protein
LVTVSRDTVSKDTSVKNAANELAAPASPLAAAADSIQELKGKNAKLEWELATAVDKNNLFETNMEILEKENKVLYA